MLVKDEKREAFLKELPCGSCKYTGICKYYDEIPTPQETGLPNFMEVSYVCRKKEELNKPIVR